MFTLENWKKYARIAPDDDSQDSQILEFYQVASNVISGMCGLPKSRATKAEGQIQFQRKAGQAGQVVLTPQHRFTSKAGLQYKITSAENVIITSDKLEQNISIESILPGVKYNSIPLSEQFTVIPAVPQAEQFIALAITGGTGPYDALPTDDRINLAVNILVLFYYETRDFLASKSKDAVMNQVTGLVGSLRNQSAFISPDPTSEAQSAQ